MGPPRKSRSVNKRFSYGDEISPTKDGDNTNKKNQRKKKLSDMLGSHWSKEELEHFYEAYRKHGKDWRKVAAVLRNRTAEMVEAVYSLNKAYLSLPEGTASVVGFIAMMTDYYSNMEDGDGEHERNDGVETSRKPQKRLQRKVHETTSKGSVERFRSHLDAVPSDYGCLSVLKKKRTGGSRPRAVGKRTPRFPVSHSYENIKGEKHFLQTRKGLKLRGDNDDDDVAHSIAMALAEASKRGGSPQVSQTPNRRSDSLMSSPCQSAERMYDESDVASGWFVDNGTYDDDIEGSMEADNTDFSRDKSKERTNAGYMLHDRKGSHGKKVRVDRKENKHLDYIREACSGTEGQNLGTLRRNFDVEVTDAKPSRPSSQGSKRRSKEAHTGRGMPAPSYHNIRVTLMKDVLADTRKFVDSFRPHWKKYHCSIMSDFWTDGKGRCLINFLVNCPVGTVFLKSIDASEHVKDAQLIVKMINDVIEDVGEENIVQFVTDNGSNFKAAGKILEEQHPKMFWTPCAAHCVNLMLGDIGEKIPKIKSVLADARAVVVYIYNHGRILNMLRKLTNNKELHRSCVTRFATQFYTIRSIHENRHHIQVLFVSEQWTKSDFAKKACGKRIGRIVAKSDFWDTIFLACQVMAPLVDVVRLVDTEERPCMGYIYDAMDKAKDLIKKNLTDSPHERLYPKVWAMIQARWSDQLHHPLHAAGYYLNPAIYYGENTESIVMNRDIRNGLYVAIDRLVPNAEENDKLRLELDLYVDAKGHFGSAAATRSREKVAPYETSAFDALETLANLSLMILPDANETAKEGKHELVDDSHLLLPMPANRHREKRKSVALTGKGYQSISRLESADYKPQTSAKDLVDDTNAASEAKESHQLITKVSRKRQKIVAPKISKAEAPSNSTHKESLEAEATHAAQLSLSKRISQSSPQLVKHVQHVSSTNHSKRDVRNSALSDVHVSEMNPSNIRTKVRSKRKMNKPETLEVSKFSDVVGTDKSSIHLPSLSHRTDKLKGKLSNCLSNQLMRRWCALEWFYSAIDDPWFAKREFVEYLYHVGLGHVPRLTRVEWGVIRSSLGKPRRFSRQFLKEEKDKLNQYRYSVRTHYTELRSGSRDGLPTDLARPLSVGQRVIAIYPRTREIHDGTVLTVDNNRCCVQFDRPELGVEKIMDTDCMPLNPFENMPTSLMRRTPVDKFFESVNEAQMGGLGKDQRLEGYTKCSSHEKLENMDEVASVKSDLQSSNGPRDFASNHHAPYTMPGTLAQIQAKELDVEAIAELTRALDKKEAVVFELRRMNDDVLENQADGDFALQDSDAFKKQYAAVLVQLNEANAQVSSALYRLRQRNTYQRNLHLAWPRAVGDLSDHGGISSSSDHTANRTEESECHVNEIVEISRTKARTMVDIAIQAMSSLKLNPAVEIEKAVDYVSDRLPSDESGIPPARPIASDPVPSSLSLHEKLVSTVKASDSMPLNPSDSNKASVPSELITHCVATLYIIQKCTERQFPPAEVASILDSAVSCLQPCSPQNLQVYAEIQKCMGIIKNQILALVPT